MITKKLSIKKFLQNIFPDATSLPVKAGFILNSYPELSRLSMKQYAKRGMIENPELYLGPLPLCVAMKLEILGITTIEKISDATRLGILDLSKFDNIGPKRWLAIMKWAQIDFSREKIFVVSLKLPLRIVSALSEVACATDYRLKNAAITYIVDRALAACHNLQNFPSPFVPSGSSEIGV